MMSNEGGKEMGGSLWHNVGDHRYWRYVIWIRVGETLKDKI